jgi:2'-5' RNA ligase
VGRPAGETTHAPWRLFFGVPLASSVAAELEERLRALRHAGGARWVVPANVHLTLLFLGAVEPRRVPAVLGQARAAAALIAPLTIRPGAIGSFGAGRRGRVIWLGLTGETDGLEDLARDLAARLVVPEPGAVVPETGAPERQPGPGDPGREVRLHLTLGREASPEVVSQARRVLDPVSWPDWHIDAFELYRSHLGSGPPRYESLARFRLGEGSR